MQTTDGLFAAMNNPYSPASTIYSPSPESVSSATSNKDHGGGHQTRQRLRPWLIDQINSGEIPGLEWLDLEKMIFKIPWKHFGRPGVDENIDAMLFKRWALHTKKHEEGQTPDVSTWKTRFRCALYKLPDINELCNLNNIEGENPYKVYQFVKKEGKKNESRPRSPLMLPSVMNPIMLSPAPSNISAITDDTNLSTAETLDELTLNDDDLLLADDIGFMSNMDEIGDIDIGLFRAENEPLSSIQPTLQPSIQPNNQPSIQTTLSANILPTATAPSTQVQLPNQQQTNGSSSPARLLVKLFYADQEVENHYVENMRGLRIAFDPPPPLPDNFVPEEASQVVCHIFGPFQADQIYFPVTANEDTMKLLQWIKRGLVLQIRNGQLLATRLCQAKVFYSDSVSPTGVNELRREHTTVVFDYYNDFLPKLEAAMRGQRSIPTFELFFSFAQRWSQEEPIRNNFIYVNVVHCLAKENVLRWQNQRSDILISEPNMLDDIAQAIENLRVNNQVPNANLD